MTVQELITLLQKHDPQMRVVIPGYEEGYDDVARVEAVGILRDWNEEEWGCGQHADANDEGHEADETALLLQRLSAHERPKW